MLILLMLTYLFPLFIPVVFGPFLLGLITYPIRALVRLLRSLEDSGRSWVVLAIILAVICPFFFR